MGVRKKMKKCESWILSIKNWIYESFILLKRKGRLTKWEKGSGEFYGKCKGGERSFACPFFSSSFKIDFNKSGITLVRVG
jgi:hypothetical protein